MLADVRRRVHAAPGRGDVLSGEAADDVDEAVGFAQVAEEEARLDVPEGDADEVGQVERGGDPLFIRVGGGDAVEPRIGQGHGPDVRLPLAVVVGVDGGAGPGQEIEQGRLARPGVAEQGHVHATSKAGLAGGVKATVSNRVALTARFPL